MSATGAGASEIVDALGVAWTMYGLYPDPENQPAFARAIADVGECASNEMVSVSVGPGSFLIDGEEFRTERQAAERLAVRLFVHNVESMRIAETPSERDIIRLFDILSREPETVAMAGGVAAALARDGVTLFSVVERSDLGDMGEVDQLDRDDEVRAVMTDGHDPAAFAAELEGLGEGDPAAGAKLIHARYHDVLGRVAPDDTAGREAVVQAFVEAYFHLPELHQVAVLEIFLANLTEAADRAFLDQFAGHELARLSSRLDSQAMSLLMDYANIVTDPEADARSGELLALLEQAPEAVTSAREMIASRVTERFGDLVDSSDAATPIEVEIPDQKFYFFTVLDVFRNLLTVESRDERFGRLMRIWSGKVVSAVRRGEFRRAELWLRAVLDNPTFPDDRRPAVEAALESLLRSSLVDQLVRYQAALEDPTPVIRVLSVIGSRLGDPLVDRLADAEEAAERRMLTQMVAFVAADDPAVVSARLSDPRWFLVRNLAVALRKSGRIEAAEGLRKIVDHEDHRVRIEAIRGLGVLEGERAIDVVGAALSDDDDAVRTAALASLGGLGGADAEQRLVEALEAPSLTPEQRRKTIELIGRDPSPEAHDLLIRLANKRFAVTATARLVRDAARAAIDRKGSR